MRSGTLPISFNIANIGPRMHLDDSLNFTGFELLSRHVERWKNVSFKKCFRPLDWAIVNEGHPPVLFAHLENMVISKIDNVESRDFAFFAPIAPRLQKLTIMRANFDLHLASFAKELVCTEVGLGAQASFLSRSSPVTKAFTSTQSSLYPSTRSFHHPTLTHVSVDHDSFMLLATARMPNLKHLAVKLEHINKQHLNIIARLLQRAEVKLRSFSLTLTKSYEDSDFPDDFASSVASMSTLEALSISFSDEERLFPWTGCTEIRLLRQLISRLELYRIHSLTTLRLAYFIDASFVNKFVIIPSLEGASFIDASIFNDFVIIPSSEGASFWTRLKHFGVIVKVKGDEGGFYTEELAQRLEVAAMQALDIPMLEGVQLDRVVYKASSSTTAVL